jgi:hypothetical protein
MDEVLEVLGLVADLGGLPTWLSRLLGIVAVLAGVAIWLFTDIALLVPAVLVAVGLALLVVPEPLLAVAELA